MFLITIKQHLELKRFHVTPVLTKNKTLNRNKIRVDAFWNGDSKIQPKESKVVIKTSILIYQRQYPFWDPLASKTCFTNKLNSVYMYVCLSVAFKRKTTQLVSTKFATHIPTWPVQMNEKRF